MSKCVIIVEKFDVNQKNCNKIDKLRKNFNEVVIVVFSDEDEEIIINEFSKQNITIINAKKKIGTKALFEFDECAYNQTKKILSQFSCISNYARYANTIKSLFGNIYIKLNLNNLYEKYFRSLIESNGNAEFIIIGKRCNKSLEGNLFSKSLVKYETSVSYSAIRLFKEMNLKYKIIESKSRVKEYFVNKIQPILINIGMVYFNPMILFKSKLRENINITVLRSPTHFKVLNILNSNKGLDISNHDFIVVKKSKSLVDNIDDFNQIELKPKIHQILKNLCFGMRRKELKRICEANGMSWLYTYFACVVNISVEDKLRNIIKNNYKCFFTFEESNYYGALISYTIKDIIAKTVVIQHGVTVAYGYTMPLISQQRWVWGNQFKKVYEELGESPDRIVNIGNIVNNIENLQHLNELQNLKVLLAPAQGSIQEVSRWIEDIVTVLEEIKEKNITEIIISIHPNSRYNLSPILDKLNSKNKIIIIKGVNLSVIDDANVIFTGNTTVGYEGILRGKRVLYYGNNKEIVYEYLKHQFIFKGNDRTSLNKAIYNCLNMKYDDLKLIREDYEKEYL